MGTDPQLLPCRAPSEGSSRATLPPPGKGPSAGGGAAAGERSPAAGEGGGGSQQALSQQRPPSGQDAPPPLSSSRDPPGVGVGPCRKEGRCRGRGGELEGLFFPDLRKEEGETPPR